MRSIYNRKNTALLERMRFISNWMIHGNKWAETAVGKPSGVALKIIKILQPRGTGVASKLIDQ